MTKELEKEAERFVSEKSDKGNFDIEQFGKAYFSESSMEQAYLAGAEPREKRIADLEKENAKLQAKIDDWQSEYIELENFTNNEIAELEEQNRKAKELLRNIIRVTWGEGWNYNLEWKVKAEQFLKEIK